MNTLVKTLMIVIYVVKGKAICFNNIMVNKFYHSLNFIVRNIL